MDISKNDENVFTEDNIMFAKFGITSTSKADENAPTERF